MDCGVYCSTSKVGGTSEDSKPEPGINVSFNGEVTALSITEASPACGQVGRRARLLSSASGARGCLLFLADWRPARAVARSSLVRGSSRFGAHFLLPCASLFLCPLGRYSSSWARMLVTFSGQIVLPPR